MGAYMAEHPEYKTLKEVIEAFALWEQEKKAHSFGYTLFETAQHIVGTDPDEIYGIFLQTGILSECLTDDFRRLVIRYHARGVSTTTAIEAILSETTYQHITPFFFFKFRDVCGYDNIKRYLVSRVSYLKPSHPRFPHNKFGEFWAEERAAYVDTIKEIPLTQPQERLQKLSEHYTELETLYREADRATDKERYHKCMMRTLAGIELMTRAPVHKSLPRADTNVIEVDAQPTPIEVKNE